jgi:hypothetical protein
MRYKNPDKGAMRTAIRFAPFYKNSFAATESLPKGLPFLSISSFKTNL